jgi:hypothetical protein
MYICLKRNEMENRDGMCGVCDIVYTLGEGRRRASPLRFHHLSKADYRGQGLGQGRKGVGIEISSRMNDCVWGVGLISFTRADVLVTFFFTFPLFHFSFLECAFGCCCSM